MIKKFMNLIFILTFIAIVLGLVTGVGSLLINILASTIFKVQGNLISTEVFAYGIATALLAFIPCVISFIWSGEVYDFIEDKILFPLFYPLYEAAFIIKSMTHGGLTGERSKPRDIEIKESDGPFSLNKVPTGKVKFNADGSVKEVVTYKNSGFRKYK